MTREFLPNARSASFPVNFVACVIYSDLSVAGNGSVYVIHQPWKNPVLLRQPQIFLIVVLNFHGWIRILPVILLTPVRSPCDFNHLQWRGRGHSLFYFDWQFCLKYVQLLKCIIVSEFESEFQNLTTIYFKILKPNSRIINQHFKSTNFKDYSSYRGKKKKKHSDNFFLKLNLKKLSVCCSLIKYTVTSIKCMRSLMFNTPILVLIHLYL